MINEKYAKQDELLFYHIKQLQAGNVESYNEIYNLSGKYIYKIIYDIVQDYHTTEDMLQETFLKIYNSIGTLQSPEAFYVWAGRIATNLCIRYIHKYRKESLQPALDDGEGNEQFIFDTVADDNEMFIPESVIDNNEHQRLIGEVIDSLSIEQKLAVQCFYFEEMSVKEIAQAMECSEGTIKSRLNYARKSIKEAVLRIERTQGTKLYSFGALPILLWAYRGFAELSIGSAAAATATATATNVSAMSSAEVATYNMAANTTMEAAGAVVTTGATTTSSVAGGASASAAAGISGKLVAIVAAGIIAVGGAVGTGVVLFNGGQDKEVVETESNDENVSTGDKENETNNAGEVVYVIPEGGKYEIKATGQVLEAGAEFPRYTEKGDCYYYGDYKYEHEEYADEWSVVLNVEEREKVTSVGKILESIAGEYVTYMTDTYKDCSSLTEVPELPSGIIAMFSTFENCSSLTDVPEIPSEVEYMNSAFSGCSSLTEVPEIPSGVTGMSYTFKDCSSLIKVPEIPSGVTELHSTFSGCSSLTEVPEIPSGVINMMQTFSGCSSLTEVPEIPSGVTSMSYTFEDCSSLIKVPEIPSGVTELQGTFLGCSSLTEVPEIPSGVTSMSYTFSGCSSLTEAPEIPSGVTNMSYTFYNCSNLAEAPEIPSGVTELNSTFSGCSSLTEAPEIPSGVTNMSYTFYNCSNLAEAPKLPLGVTELHSTFSGCTSLKEAPEVPLGVQNMESTFQFCSGLIKAPNIPESVTNMNNTFFECTNLTGNIVINANPTEYKYCFLFVYFDKQNITLSGTSTMLEELKGTGF